MDDASGPAVVFLLGATATGKTAIAIELAQRLPVEIVSVDSALIYRLMNIGTAKPDKEALRITPHRLVDIINPWENYSVAEFIRDAQCEINTIRAKQKIPLLVGGTMMYYNALEKGLSLMPEVDEKRRTTLAKEMESKGLAAMHRELAAVDPESAKRIHPNDPQRVLRALGVWHSSGRSLDDWHRQAKSTARIQAIKFGLFPDKRRELHRRIECRFRKMLDDGFVDEVESLRALPHMQIDFPSMRCVGYRQIWDYLDGNGSYQEMIDKGVAATRQLAKRQITWMRKMQQLTLFDSDEASLKHIVEQISRALESHPALNGRNYHV